jgi:hypothetical protein
MNKKSIEDVIVIVLYIMVMFGYICIVPYSAVDEFRRQYSKRFRSIPAEELPQRFIVVWFRDLRDHFAIYFLKRN